MGTRKLRHGGMEEGLNGHTKAITLVKKEVYKITEFGKAILKDNPSSLTIKDLKRYDSAVFNKTVKR
jgi:hypothetical protein